MARYIIPKYNLQELTKRINHIRNKGVHITFDIINDDLDYPAPELGEGRFIPCVEVEVEGTYIINGWRFVGTIEHARPENIIRLADYSLEGNIPERYRTADKECEHCHIKRDRNDTYLVFNEDTLEWKQVGRTCLKNYTSGLDSQTCAEFLSVINELRKIDDELEDHSYDRDSAFLRNEAYDMDYVKRKAYVFVQRNGYVSGVTGKQFVDKLNKGEIEGEATQEQLQDVSNWLENSLTNDYMHNARAIWNKRYFENRDAGILTSCIHIYLRDNQRAIARNIERQNNLNNPANVFAGDVGDKVTFTIATEPVVLYTRNSGSRYSYDDEYPVYKIVDTNGKTYVWGNSGNKHIGIGDTLTGTVKKLIERPNGEKQTEVTRCKIIEHAPPPVSSRRGFFDPVDLDV